MFAEAFKKFQQDFPPVQDLGESNIQLTTEELMKTFEDHGVFEIEVKTMYQQLEAAGYVYKAIHDEDRIVFRWLL